MMVEQKITVQFLLCQSFCTIL